MAISDINLNGGTQTRLTMDTEAIARYAGDMRRGDVFPPVVVFHDGMSNWLGDGSHRIYAALSIGQQDIDADVRPGTRNDALRYALTANDTHGVRTTNADKRHGVEMALDCEAWRGMSNVAIAEMCRVSEGLVRRIKKEREDRNSYGTNSPEGVKWNNRLLADLEPGQTLIGFHRDDDTTTNIFIRRSSSPCEEVRVFDYSLLGARKSNTGNDDDNDTWILGGMNPQGAAGIRRRMTTIYEYEYGPLLWNIQDGDAYRIIFDSFCENHNITAEERYMEAMQAECAMMRKHGCAVNVRTA
jgi:hypothetical protein